MTKYLHSYLKNFNEDDDIMKLLKEIEMVTKFSLSPYLSNSMVIHYLKDYRARGSITKDSIDAVPFSDSLVLRQKIKKLHDTQLYWFCNEIAGLKRSGVERNEGNTLYVFLNRYLKDAAPKKRKRK